MRDYNGTLASRMGIPWAAWYLAARALASAARAGRSSAERLALERPRWFCWTPFLGGLGVLAAGQEAAWFWLILAVLALLGLAMGLVRRLAGVLAGLYIVAPLVVGWCAMTYAPFAERTVALAYPARSVVVSGRVVQVDPAPEHGAKLWIARVRIEGMDSDSVPQAVRITSRHAAARELVPGDWVSLRADVHPPSPPAQPGGYDFARSAWFDGVGAVGWARGAPRLTHPLGAASFGERVSAAWARTRARVAEDIQARIGGLSGALAAALLVGQRSALDEATTQDLRYSGLAHLLAISGLHMALVAGFVFALVRFLGGGLVFAFGYRGSPRVLAAWCAIGSAAGYLALSGAPISATRAFIMAFVALLMVLCGRRALSLRNVALAAWVIILVRPWSLYEIGFAMSFAAVTALIAWAEFAFDPRRQDAPLPPPLASKVWRFVAALALTSLIAGAASGVFAAHAFNRVATYSLLANVLAMPLMSVLVMPAGVLVLILTPFGLAAPALAAMGWGLDLLRAIAAFVSDLPAASVVVPSFAPWVLGILVVSGAWLCLWRGRWRRWGIFGLALGMAWHIAVPIRGPDVLITSSAGNLALRGEDGRLVLARSRGDSWTARHWLAKEGDGRSLEEAAAGDCSRAGCWLVVRGVRAALVFDEALFLQACAEADVVVARFVAPAEGCRDTGAVLVDRATLMRRGSVALWHEEGGLRMEGSQDAPRPWRAAF